MCPVTNTNVVRHVSQYAHHITKDSFSEDYYSTDAPIKKLISEEISKRPSTRSKSPSVVARLMGVDVIPFDSRPGEKFIEVKDGTPTDKKMDKNRSKKSSVDHLLSEDGYPYQHSRKAKSREHPQEEQLQKFKQEFEAWQSARFNKCSNFVKSSSSPPEMIAQGELNREKMYIYANSYRNTKFGSLREHNDLSGVSERIQKKSFSYSDEEKESLYPDRGIRTDCRASQLMNSDVVSAPSRIVVLRPGPDTTNISADSWGNTPSTSEGTATIEDFLEEVKERLESEMQGKCSKRSTTVRGQGIETPYREKPSKSREIAQSIAQEVRDSVLGMNLPRSESTRSYEMQNGTYSPEFFNRDTRKLLAERLKNVLKGEKNREAIHKSSAFSMSGFEKGKPGHSRSTWNVHKMSHPEIFGNELQKDRGSFREEFDEVGMPISPRNLVRSLSAPVSVAGTKFGKLLLEDRHVLSGAQIMRKHEATEKVIKKQKKDKFNIREKVSSFRYNLTLRGRQFRRRVKSMERWGQNKNSRLKDIPNGPTTMMNFYDTPVRMFLDSYCSHLTR